MSLCFALIFIVGRVTGISTNLTAKVNKMMATPKLPVHEYRATKAVNIGFIIIEVQSALIGTYSTGSKPPLENGLHLTTLFRPSHRPFAAPYLDTASYV